VEQNTRGRQGGGAGETGLLFTLPFQQASRTLQGCDTVVVNFDHHATVAMHQELCQLGIHIGPGQLATSDGPWRDSWSSRSRRQGDGQRGRILKELEPQGKGRVDQPGMSFNFTASHPLDKLFRPKFLRHGFNYRGRQFAPTAFTFLNHISWRESRPAVTFWTGCITLREVMALLSGEASKENSRMVRIKPQGGAMSQVPSAPVAGRPHPRAARHGYCLDSVECRRTVSPRLPAQSRRRSPDRHIASRASPCRKYSVVNGPWASAPGRTGGDATRRLVVCSPPAYNEPP
jgi:hypothetical protein